MKLECKGGPLDGHLVEYKGGIEYRYTSGPENGVYREHFYAIAFTANCGKWVLSHLDYINCKLIDAETLEVLP